jgi:hypothetical protein
LASSSPAAARGFFAREIPTSQMQQNPSQFTMGGAGGAWRPCRHFSAPAFDGAGVALGAGKFRDAENARAIRAVQDKGADLLRKSAARPRGASI